jgi:hypothetical protein
MIHELITTGLALGLGGLAAVTTLKCRALTAKLEEKATANLVWDAIEDLCSEVEEIDRGVVRINDGLAELKAESTRFALSRGKRGKPLPGSYENPLVGTADVVSRLP